MNSGVIAYIAAAQCRKRRIVPIPQHIYVPDLGTYGEFTRTSSHFGPSSIWHNPAVKEYLHAGRYAPGPDRPPERDRIARHLTGNINEYAANDRVASDFVTRATESHG
jgi:hypothetical protein